VSGKPVSTASAEIFIVDDNPEACAAFSIVFTHAGFQATVFTDGELFLRAARIRIPTCVLLDICMPGRSGLDILTDLDAANYPAPVLILSGRSDIPTAVEAIRNGASDFIEKRLDADTIVSRVREAIDRWTDRRQSSEIATSSFPGYELLTRRERDVLFQITAAASNKEAAKNLGISRRTVEIHRGHIMRKLGARNTVHLVRIALNNLHSN
jgi:two-component system response regulator FixJ